MTTLSTEHSMPEGEVTPRGQQLQQCERGTALTEFVIVLPVFLITLSGLLALTEVVLAMTLVEVRAYQTTMGEVMQVPRYDVDDADGQGLGRHIRGLDAYEHAHDNINTAPPYQRASFYGQFASHHNPRFSRDSTAMTHVTSSTNLRTYSSTGQVAPEIQGILESGGTSYYTLRSHVLRDLFAFGARVAYEDRDLIAQDPAFQPDFTGDFFDNLVDRAHTTDQMSGDMISAMLGHRYGTISAGADTSVSRQIYAFDYSMEAGAYFVSGVPSYAPNAMGGTPMEMQMRATAFYRSTLEGPSGGSNQSAPYVHLMRISANYDSGSPMVAPMGYYLGNTDLNIPDDEPAFGGWLAVPSP